ncbi:unnamed protein product [Merluccius merluccius]
MSKSYSVSLAGPAPWGFRLQGGKDFCLPLTISRLTDGGKAARANLSVGDVVLSIDGIATNGMNHLEAQNKIKSCTGHLSLTLQRGSAAKRLSSYPLQHDETQEIHKPVPIPHPASSATYTRPSPQPASAAYNKTARPFGSAGGGAGGGAASPTASRVASIPSASSAFTPAGPSLSPQPPFPLRSSSLLPSPPTGLAAKSAPGGSSSSAFTSPSSTSPSTSSSSPVRVTGTTSSSSDPGVPQPSVYNTPINLYSNVNASEVVLGQRRGIGEAQGLSERSNGKPDVQPEVTHGLALSDASKKRLIEDTEDWHPRSGTSQSRSFRMLAQLTGTENGGEVMEDASPRAYSSPSAKTFSKAPMSPRNGNGVAVVASPKFNANQAKPSWQPGSPAGIPKGGGGPAPSFGRVTEAAPQGPQRPTPQPHPQDLDSLVQRAEHIPAGTRTPMCNKCNTVIRGPFLVAMGMSWHPEEFNCSHCRGSLVDCGFVEERGQVFCEHCYEQYLAPTCARCQNKVLGEVMNALKQTWHVHCFVCVSCQQPIRGNTFHMEDGKPYCEQDYYTLFGTSCHGCDFPIEAGDKFLEALGYTWHDTCFVCAVCSSSLEGQAFFSKKDKPLCKKHANTVKI